MALEISEINQNGSVYKLKDATGRILLGEKQNKLIAGKGIKIVDNVISAVGGGGIEEVEVLPTPATENMLGKVYSKGGVFYKVSSRLTSGMVIYREVSYNAGSYNTIRYVKEKSTDIVVGDTIKLYEISSNDEVTLYTDNATVIEGNAIRTSDGTIYYYNNAIREVQEGSVNTEYYYEKLYNPIVSEIPENAEDGDVYIKKGIPMKMEQINGTVIYEWKLQQNDSNPSNLFCVYTKDENPQIGDAYLTKEGFPIGSISGVDGDTLSITTHCCSGTLKKTGEIVNLNYNKLYFWTLSNSSDSINENIVNSDGKSYNYVSTSSNPTVIYSVNDGDSLFTSSNDIVYSHNCTSNGETVTYNAGSYSSTAYLMANTFDFETIIEKKLVAKTISKLGPAKTFSANYTYSSHCNSGSGSFTIKYYGGLTHQVFENLVVSYIDKNDWDFTGSGYDDSYTISAYPNDFDNNGVTIISNFDDSWHLGTNSDSTLTVDELLALL